MTVERYKIYERIRSSLESLCAIRPSQVPRKRIEFGFWNDEKFTYSSSRGVIIIPKRNFRPRGQVSNGKQEITRRSAINQCVEWRESNSL